MRRKKLKKIVASLSFLLLLLSNFFFAAPEKAQAAVIFYLPWTYGETYLCTQGNLSNYSHRAGEADQYAWDFYLPEGTYVRASAPGVVVAMRKDATGYETNSWGNYIVIRHADGRYTRYAHLQYGSIPANISPGAYVHQGQIIARSGNTGTSTGPHLHFQVEDAYGNSLPASFYEGTPVAGGYYTSQNRESTTSPPSPIVGNAYSGDFDGDGKADIATLYDYGNQQVGVFIFESSKSYFCSRKYQSNLWIFDANKAKTVSGDFDGDGKADLGSLYDYGNGMVGVFTFDSSKNYALLKRWASSQGMFNVSKAKVVAGDFDKDGRADIGTLYDYGSGKVGVIVFESSQGYKMSTKWVSDYWMFDLTKAQLVTGDFDKDGKADIGCLYDYGSAKVGVFTFESSKGYIFSSKYKSDYWIYDLNKAKVVSGDFDNDGISDIGSLYDYGNGKVGVFTFESSKNYIVLRKWVSDYWIYDLSQAKVATGDKKSRVDNDALTDILTLYNYGNGKVGVFSFESLQSYRSIRKWVSDYWIYDLSSAR